MSKKPLPRKTRVVNRGYQYSRKRQSKKYNSYFERYRFYDIYYVENIIQPSVEDNGENIKVPIVYGSMERWK